VEKYKAIVAENPKVVMIQLSLDRNKEAAEGWAVKDKLPWYTVLPSEYRSGGFAKYKSTRYVPEYGLFSADGKRLGSGREVFEQDKKLSQ
jgi:hypothetical protein